MILNQLREGLFDINSKLCELLEERKQIVAQILSQKKSQGALVYDPRQEISVFTRLRSQLMGLSLPELLAFSLVMEGHALADYPAWSRFEHLSEVKGELYEQINPCLLQVCHPELFALLKIKEHFMVQIRGILG